MFTTVSFNFIKTLQKISPLKTILYSTILAYSTGKRFFTTPPDTGYSSVFLFYFIYEDKGLILHLTSQCHDFAMGSRLQSKYQIIWVHAGSGLTAVFKSLNIYIAKHSFT